MGSTFNLNLLALFLRAKAGAWVRRSPEQSQRKYPPPPLLIAVAARTVWAAKQSMKNGLF